MHTCADEGKSVDAMQALRVRRANVDGAERWLRGHVCLGGAVWIPHPDDQDAESLCEAGCKYMADGIRHHKDCGNVRHWREALALRRVGVDGVTGQNIDT